MAPDSMKGGGQDGPSDDEECEGENDEVDNDLHGKDGSGGLMEGGDGATAEARQQEGMRRAKQKERTKQAARRLVVFGPMQPEGDPRRLCEALVNGRVVEPSFAKGDWAVRWRDW